MMKMTNRVALEIALSAIEAQNLTEYRMAGTEDTFSAEEAKAKLYKMIEQLDKKASAEKKPTATQNANAEMADALYAELVEAGKPMTVSDMIAELPSCAGKSNQKVSAVVRSLLGVKLERVEEKRKAYFKVIA